MSAYQLFFRTSLVVILINLFGCAPPVVKQSEPDIAADVIADTNTSMDVKDDIVVQDEMVEEVAADTDIKDDIVVEETVTEEIEPETITSSVEVEQSKPNITTEVVAETNFSTEIEKLEKEIAEIEEVVTKPDVVASKTEQVVSEVEVDSKKKSDTVSQKTNTVVNIKIRSEDSPKTDNMQIASLSPEKKNLLKKKKPNLSKLSQQEMIRKMNRSIIVDINTQQLFLYDEDDLIKTYAISTSRHGIGNQRGSHKTPLGKHIIKSKIGDNAPKGTIFKARVNTGQLANINQEEKDFVTTRIMWLEGQEKGINQGAGIDSYKRYIYIHGTPAENKIGTPASEGCVRMLNEDVIDLFDRVLEGTTVEIKQHYADVATN